MSESGETFAEAIARWVGEPVTEREAAQPRMALLPDGRFALRIGLGAQQWEVRRHDIGLRWPFTGYMTDVELSGVPGVTFLTAVELPVAPRHRSMVYRADRPNGGDPLGVREMPSDVLAAMAYRWGVEHTARIYQGASDVD